MEDIHDGLSQPAHKNNLCAGKSMPRCWRAGYGHTRGDVLGYSQFIVADEVRDVACVSGHRRDLIDPTIASHRGLSAKTTGDGMLVEFTRAVDAVRCAVFLYSIDV